jgi:hypothetical protein
MAKSKDVITQIQKASRRKFTADEKIRIVLEGLRGKQSISKIGRTRQRRSAGTNLNRLVSNRIIVNILCSLLSGYRRYEIGGKFNGVHERYDRWQSEKKTVCFTPLEASPALSYAD